MAEMSGALFQWRNEDDDGACYGEGVSRPRHNARVRDYTVMVYPRGGQPLKWYTRAESKRHAIRYAQNRWPGATVEVV